MYMANNGSAIHLISNKLNVIETQIFYDDVKNIGVSMT